MDWIGLVLAFEGKSSEVCMRNVHAGFLFSATLTVIETQLYHSSSFYISSQIGTATQPPQSPPCSPEVEDFFYRGFVLEPSERATAAELLRHPVLVTGDYDHVLLFD